MSVPQDSTVYMFPDKKKIKKPTKCERFLDCLRFRCGRTEDVEGKRKALIEKEGGYRINYTGLSEHKRKYFADMYITLIDIPWRYALAILFNVFLVTYLIFGVLWWLMAHNNGDFDNLDNPKHVPCLLGVKSFAGSLLFSIETQTTIGYGYAYPNAHCAGTLPLIYLQVTIGFFLESFLLGFIFVKIARPKNRAKTLMLSKNAVVCQEDGGLCLQVRVGDMRKSHLIEASVQGMLVRKHVTEEGVTYPLYQTAVDFEANGMKDRVFLLWPMTLSHRITPDSPFWNIRPSDLCSEKYELIIFLVGTVEATGEVCEARTSYTPREILWGHRFERIEEYDLGNGRWHVDFSGFNDVVYCQNIRHSAEELDHFKESNTEGVYDKAVEKNEREVGGAIRYDLNGDASNGGAKGGRILENKMADTTM
ncbi:hypothetical protein SNE40_002601 [Patella caerulea]|uniref:Uncharacterized protein n=2 Tax=Patella caerulea TaxID=87958 RepID=A0AAN8QEE5_PATCE